MAEADLERGSRFSRSTWTARQVTNSAGRNIAIAGLGPRTVTLITGDVRAEASRNCHGDALTQGPMTSSTRHIAHPDMARMIELHRKAAQARKRFQRT